MCEKKRIMLLGDSIRMGYCEEVKKIMGDSYEFWWPEENCRFAKYTLRQLIEWIPAFPKPDVIHWNNGLWDAGIYFPDDGVLTPIPEYVETLGRILRQLQKTGAKVIFATSTPVSPKKSVFINERTSVHRNEDIAAFNRAAVALMQENGVMINDLYALVEPHIDEYICDDLIHLTDAGKAVCANAVADAIRKNL